MNYRVCLIADNHFVLGLDGNYYVNGTYTERYLRRFTSNFDEVVVVARGHKATSLNETTDLRLSGGARVSFCLIPDFNGVKEYLFRRKTIKKHLLEAFKNSESVFVRMPCILTTISIRCATRLKKPIMLDVGADPASIYLSSKPTLFEKVLSTYMSSMCKKACIKANGVSYVTTHVLQDKYPCKALLCGESIEFFTASISNVDIPDEAFSLRNYGDFSNEVHLLHISNNISQNSGKGHYEAISVLKELRQRGINAKLTFVGGGDGIPFFKKLSTQFGIQDSVIFTGRIGSREQYYKIISDNHIFLFPSHSEGLPRVLLEVMATGMICLASNVDGIPEILDKDDIFDYHDYLGFTERIIRYINNSQLVNENAKRNYEVAKLYSSEKLKDRYDEYYGKVRKLLIYSA